METKGMINVYECPNGHCNVTGNMADGTTPFMIRCRKPDCDRMAKSNFYRVSQGLKPEYVWCAGPVSREWAERQVDAAMREHKHPLDADSRDRVIMATLQEYNERGVLYLRKATPLDLETFGFKTRFA